MIDLKALEKANKVSVTYKVDDIDSEYVKSLKKLKLSLILYEKCSSFFEIYLTKTFLKKFCESA